MLDLSQPTLASEPPKPSAQWTRLGKPLNSNRQAQYRERREGCPNSHWPFGASPPPRCCSNFPLGPYILLPKVSTALVASVAITLLALAIFGYVKGHFTGAPPVRSSIQTVLIGGVAVGAAFLIARVIS